MTIPMSDNDLVPSTGFVEAPPIPERNIFPMEWRSQTPKLAEIYERSKQQVWNPSTIPWDELDPDALTAEERTALMYWFAVLANFDGSGPAVFAKAMIHSFEVHEEDPVRKCFFSITRDEVNHEECCQRVIQTLVPGGPIDFERTTPLERAAVNNIQWLYHNGARYWTGFGSALERHPLPVLFTSFMMGEVASSTLFRSMADRTTFPTFREMFTRVGRDESRHLQICLTLLEDRWPGLGDEHKATITKQIRAGFVFLSMVLWEPPPNQFWDIPSYFIDNHRRLLDTARGAGLGLPTNDELADNWRLALGRVAKIVDRWGIEFPAIPELDIAGIDVGDISPEDIIPVF